MHFDIIAWQLLLLPFSDCVAFFWTPAMYTEERNAIAEKQQRHLPCTQKNATQLSDSSISSCQAVFSETPVSLQCIKHGGPSDPLSVL